MNNVAECMINVQMIVNVLMVILRMIIEQDRCVGPDRRCRRCRAKKSGKNVLTMAKNQERKQETSGSTSKTAHATTGKATTGKATGTLTKAYEQIYGDDYVQQRASERGVGGYIPMYDAPYHYEHVQPVYQPQLASS
eukprot:293438_1